MNLGVTSVTGLVNLEDLGPTMTHDNLGVVRQYPYSSKYNLKLDDDKTKAIIVDELVRYKAVGGKTLVENTVEGLSRNLELLKDVSIKSGVNIVAGTGFYIAAAQSHSVLNYSVEKMHDIMLKELSEGNQDGIRCGIVGEIGCSFPIEAFEKRAIQASALIQQEINKPVTFHPGRDPEAPFEIIRIFCEAGGKSEDVVMSHLDRTIFNPDQLLEFAKLKTFTQFDLFGTEVSHYQIQESIDFLSDAQRIKRLKLLKENGFLRQITISHDIHSKHRMVNFGGHGYGHFLQNVVPKMKKRGFTEQEINIITVENPKRWLSQGAEKVN